MKISSYTIWFEWFINPNLPDYIRLLKRIQISEFQSIKYYVGFVKIRQERMTLRWNSKNISNSYCLVLPYIMKMCINYFHSHQLFTGMNFQVIFYKYLSWGDLNRRDHTKLLQCFNVPECSLQSSFPTFPTSAEESARGPDIVKREK